MLFRGVILEGVACAGKTSALRSLLEHPAFPGLSSIVLTEHHTQRVLEGCAPRAELTTPDNLSLLQAHTGYFAGLHQRLAAMDRWRAEDLPNPRTRVVLERFHLTHVCSYAHLVWQDVEAIDAELARIGFSLVLLTVGRDALRRRLAERGPGWATFMSEPGQRHRLDSPTDLDSQVDCFLRQQDELLALARRSGLACTELESSTLPSERIAEHVLKLLS